MRKSQFGWVGVAVVLGLWLAPSRAEAKGFVLITHGDSVKHLGDVPAAEKESVQKATGQDGVAIGYSYSYFGVFWIDLWTWHGEYCLYKDRTVWKLERSEAAELLKVDEKKLPKPFTYSVPPGLLIVGILIAIAILSKVFGNKGGDAPPPEAPDPGTAA